MLVYSHIWDALLKLVSIAAIIVAAISLHLAERIESAGVATQSAAEGILIALCIVSLSSAPPISKQFHELWPGPVVRGRVLRLMPISGGSLCGWSWT